MKLLSILLTLLAGSFLLPRQTQQSVPPPLPSSTRTYRFEHGLWFDGKTFKPGTFYSVNGVFTHKAPLLMTETIDLQGRYVVPPFGDAHCHHFDSTYDIAEMTEQYLKHGVFYAQTQANSFSGAKQIADKVNIPTGVDVRYAHGCLTCNNGHPIRIYEGLALGYYSNKDQFAHKEAVMKSRLRENDCYFIVDTKADIERKWSQILANKPDLVKVILSHSENYDKQKRETGHGEGLDPKLLPEIVKRAHTAGLRVSVHIDSADDFRTALSAGVDMMAHLCGYYMDASDDIASYQLTPEDAARTAKQKITVIPTASLAGAMDEGANKVRTRENQIRNLNLLKKAGVHFGVGTDNYESDSLPEALYLSKMGIWSNLELLKIWCEETPRLVFPNRKIGALRDGYEASFVVLDKNPLEDFANVQTVRSRVKQGVVLPEPKQ